VVTAEIMRDAFPSAILKSGFRMTRLPKDFYSGRVSFG